MEKNQDRQLYRTTYDKAVHWLRNSYILCNDIVEIDLDFQYPEMDTDEDPCREVYQYYLSDMSTWDKDFLVEHFPGLLLGYSPLLDLYVLCVDHWGTSWDYVNWVTDLPAAEIKKQLE